jgi:predicted nucleic acid-binding protein
VIVFVDTSALLALLDEDDRWHAQAAEQFRWLAVNAQLVTHNYVELEAIALVGRRLGAAAVRRLVDDLLPLLRTVWVDEAMHGRALERHRATGKASLVDEVSFVVMREAGIELAFTFDPDFEQQGFGRPDVPASPPQPGVREEHAAYGRAAESDLVSVAEIAARSGRSANTVQSWRRRHRDFPTPAAKLGAGPIWSWPAVEAWIARRDRRSPHWGQTLTGEPMPDVVSAVRRSRAAH